LKDILQNFVPPKVHPDTVKALDSYIATRTAAGGAPPES